MKMDFPNDKIKPMYFRYLSAAFGSAMITSIYSIVDTAVVGQYHGPNGTAALAVVAPVWNIIYRLGLLVGIGGSVLFSARRGSHEKIHQRIGVNALSKAGLFALLSDCRKRYLPFSGAARF